MTLWGIQWRSTNALDGDVSHLMSERYLPLLFRTRREAQQYRDEQYGYLRTRPDLRAEPHGWRLPRAVKVNVVASESP